MVNVSSVAAFQPVPGEAVYSVTNASCSSSPVCPTRSGAGPGEGEPLCPGLAHSEFKPCSGREPTRPVWQEASAVMRPRLDALDRVAAVVRHLA